jgi:hypothetical protein
MGLANRHRSQVHDWQAPPINEGAEDPAIAEAGQDGRHPRFVEGEELSIRHFARRHGELTMVAASHMAGDLNIVGFVGEDETGR